MSEMINYVVKNDGIVYQNFSDGTSKPLNNIQAGGTKVYAADVCCGIDGSVWMLSSTPSPEADGGAKIYSYANDNWSEVAVEGPGAVKISGFKDSKIIYLTADGDIVVSDQFQNFSVVGSVPNAADISYDAGNNEYLWVLVQSEAGKEDAGLMYTSFDGTNITVWNTITLTDNIPAAISAWEDGSCWMVTIKGEVGYYETGSTSGLLSPKDVNLAADISVTISGTWIVTTTPNQNGGADLAKWDSGGSEKSNWPILPIAGTTIAGTYY